ncbi:MAG: hypothetical protein L0H84_19855 [Pseudonocardia sp.]|nr:hypothetical protein [Pseudonocardia sp.]
MADAVAIDYEALRLGFPEAVTHADGDFEIVDPTPEDRPRATDLVARLVSAPVAGFFGSATVARHISVRRR